MLCPTCFQRSSACVCPPPANDNQTFDPNLIRVPFDGVLARSSTVNRLALCYRAENLPRRRVLDFMATNLYFYEGMVIRNGEVMDPYADLDEIFGTDHDASERWIGSFLAFGVKPPRRQAQSRVLERLSRLWLAWAIYNRGQAELIIR